VSFWALVNWRGDLLQQAALAHFADDCAAQPYYYIKMASITRLLRWVVALTPVGIYHIRTVRVLLPQSLDTLLVVVSQTKGCSIYLAHSRCWCMGPAYLVQPFSLLFWCTYVGSILFPTILVQVRGLITVLGVPCFSRSSMLWC
jgi:hypothetical protein